MKRKLKNNKSKIVDIICQSILYLVIALLIVVVFALCDCGKEWDALKDNKSENIASAISTLIIFRISLYLLPALIGFIIQMLRKKPATNKKRISLLIDCYNVQFFTFSVILSLYELFALDYVLNLEILSKMDSFVFIVGFLIAIVLKKELPVEELNTIENK